MTIILDALSPRITVPSPPQSLTATSVSVSWEQPPFSLSPIGYTIGLTRDTGRGQALCPDVEDDQQAVDTSVTTFNFTNLQEFSTYRVTVTARFMAFGSSPLVPAIEPFMTPSAGTQL